MWISGRERSQITFTVWLNSIKYNYFASSILPRLHKADCTYGISCWSFLCGHFLFHKGLYLCCAAEHDGGPICVLQSSDGGKTLMPLPLSLPSHIPPPSPSCFRLPGFSCGPVKCSTAEQLTERLWTMIHVINIMCRISGRWIEEEKKHVKLI